MCGCDWGAAARDLGASSRKIFGGDADEREDRRPERSEHDDQGWTFDGGGILRFGSGGSLKKM